MPGILSENIMLQTVYYDQSVRKSNVYTIFVYKSYPERIQL